MRAPLRSDPGGEHRAKPVPPKPDGLIADVDTAIGQEIFDVAQRQRVSHVHHHDQTDDLRRAVEISERVAHRPSLPRPEAPPAFGLTKPWLVLFVGLVGNDGSDAARSCGVPIGLAGVAFVADDGARLNVGPDSEQGFEVTPVEGFAPVSSKAMMSPEASDFAWIFVVKPPRERPSAWLSCPLLLRPPTHARTMVQSNI